LSLFQHIERLQGELPWGRFLDAGTGWGSFEWALDLKTDALVAVTGSRERYQRMTADFQSSMNSHVSIVKGNWARPDLLKDQEFDTVLLDYLVGALDRFAPYYQTRLFERLKPHLTGRMYIVGLEPNAEPGEHADGQLITSLIALRDSAILLAGDRPHREYPRWWVVEQLQRSGYRVLSQHTYPILYGEAFVQAELDVCQAQIPSLSKELRTAFQASEKKLRSRLLERVRESPIQWGVDYIIVATAENEEVKKD
jgi:hypothetical protein